MAEILWRYMLLDGEIGLRESIRENAMDRMKFVNVLTFFIVALQEYGSVFD